MAVKIELRFTPDLADLLDATALARDGIDARPVPVADMESGRPMRSSIGGACPARVFLISAAALAGNPGESASLALTRMIARLMRQPPTPGTAPAAVILVGAADATAPWLRRVSICLTSLPCASALAAIARLALDAARLRARACAARREASRERAEAASRNATFQELEQVTIALSTEHDTAVLQQLILAKARALTGADAGSLYIVERGDGGHCALRFELAQNDSVPMDTFRGAMLPLSTESLAGYVAITAQVVRLADAYKLPPGAPYSLNKTFDERSGYRTRSMLVAPMINHAGDVVGVIQLINRKRHAGTRLDSPSVVNREVIPFDEDCERLVQSFASQAAVALDNQQLLESIQRLFDGFVRAAIQAIESRDPTTSGHSLRVATLSVALARAVNACDEGPLAEVRFSPAQLLELRYAALLHDFGKVGVRESVLLKAKKLYDWQLRDIEQRFATVRALLAAHFARRAFDALQAHGEDGYRARRAQLEARLTVSLADLEHDLALVRECNEPAVLPAERQSRLKVVAGHTYVDLDGTIRELLDPAEVQRLAIPKGSLDETERREIESHVVHTTRFLQLIPWTRELREIPRIAGAHHERLDGSGYPDGLMVRDIPLQSRIMAIADVYDALTAQDRPYKPALAPPVALRLLRQEAERGGLDAALLEQFEQCHVYQATIASTAG
jgi:HD-GYP domain-containing protein (c-di-GMP phosphodiesterase class II)